MSATASFASSKQRRRRWPVRFVGQHAFWVGAITALLLREIMTSVFVSVGTMHHRSESLIITENNVGNTHDYDSDADKRSLPSQPHPPSLQWAPLQEAEVKSHLQSAYSERDDYLTTYEMLSKKIGPNRIQRAKDVSTDSLRSQHRGTLPAETMKHRVVYFITPTYRRPTQIVDLTRVAQMLQLASTTIDMGHIYWIVVEDADKCTDRVRQLILDTGLSYAHLAVPSQLLKDGKRHKGIWQRNAALDAIENIGAEGVVYFGDDDNAYDARLISEILQTKGVGVLNVGFSGGRYERCHVDEKTGLVSAIRSSYLAGRKFPMDMGGWAFSTSILRVKRPRFTEESDSTFLESDFVSSVVDAYDELEPLAANCTRTLAWHVRTAISADVGPLRDKPLPPDDPDAKLISNLF